MLHGRHSIRGGQSAPLPQRRRGDNQRDDDDGQQQALGQEGKKVLQDIWDDLIPDQQDLLKDEPRDTPIMFNPLTKMYQLVPLPNLTVTDEMGLIKAGLDSQHQRPKSKYKHLRHNLLHNEKGASYFKAEQPDELNLASLREAADRESADKLKDQDGRHFGKKRMEQMQDILPSKGGAQAILRSFQSKPLEYAYPIGCLPGEKGPILPRLEPIKGEDFIDHMKFRHTANLKGASTGTESIDADNRSRRENQPLRRDGLPMKEHYEPRKELPIANLGLFGEQTRFTSVQRASEVNEGDVMKRVWEKRDKERVLPANLGLDRLNGGHQTFTLPSAGSSDSVEKRVHEEQFRRQRKDIPDVIDAYLQASGAGTFPSVQMMNTSDVDVGDIVRMQQFLKSRKVDIPEELLSSSHQTSTLPSVNTFSPIDMASRLTEKKMRERSDLHGFLDKHNLYTASHDNTNTFATKGLSANQVFAMNMEKKEKERNRLRSIMDTYDAGQSVGGATTTLTRNDLVDPMDILAVQKELRLRDQTMLHAMMEANGGDTTTMATRTSTNTRDPRITMERVLRETKSMVRSPMSQLPSISGSHETNTLPVNGNLKAQQQFMFEKTNRRPFNIDQVMKRNEPSVAEYEPKQVPNRDMTEYTSRLFDRMQFGNLVNEATRDVFMHRDQGVRVKNPITGIVGIAGQSREERMKGVPPRGIE